MANGGFIHHPQSTHTSTVLYYCLWFCPYFWDTLYKLSVLFYPILKCIAVYLLIAKLNDIYSQIKMLYYLCIKRSPNDLTSTMPSDWDQHLKSSNMYYSFNIHLCFEARRQKLIPLFFCCSTFKFEETAL